MIIKTTETEFKIDMLDTPFVSNWKEYMNRINQPSFNMHQWYFQGWKEDSNRIKANIKLIEDALQYCDKNIDTVLHILKSVHTKLSKLLRSLSYEDLKQSFIDSEHGKSYLLGTPILGIVFIS